MFKKLFGGKSAASNAPPRLAVELMEIGGDPELAFTLIQPGADDILGALEAWHWIGLDGFAVIAVSAFGEIFLRAANGSVHQLDMIEGGIVPVTESVSEFVEKLQDVEERDNLLLSGLVIGARAKGMLLARDECYDFLVPPVLGGSMDLEHVQKILFVVKVSIAGQIYQQTKDLPAGTQINKITISD